MSDETKTAEQEFLEGFNETGPEDSGETPIEEPVQAAAEPEPVTEPTPEPEAEKAPWEIVPEEHRDSVYQIAQRAASLEQSFKSEKNRAIGQQRRADELAAKLAEMEKRLDSGSQQPATSPVDETLQALDASLPEVADVFRQLKAENEQLRADMDSRVQPVERTAAEFSAQAQEAVLDTARPGWRDAIQEPDFAPAMARAPRLVREAFEANSAGISSAEDAAVVIDWYRSLNPNAAVQPSPTQTQPNPASTTQSARRNVVQAAVSPRVRDSVDPKPDEYEDDSFEAGVRQFERELAQGRI